MLSWLMGLPMMTSYDSWLDSRVWETALGGFESGTSSSEVWARGLKPETILNSSTLSSMEGLIKDTSPFKKAFFPAMLESKEVVMAGVLRQSSRGTTSLLLTKFTHWNLESRRAEWLATLSVHNAMGPAKVYILGLRGRGCWSWGKKEYMVANTWANAAPRECPVEQTVLAFVPNCRKWKRMLSNSFSMTFLQPPWT